MLWYPHNGFRDRSATIPEKLMPVDSLQKQADRDSERQRDPKGDRVKLTLSGKFLPYKEY